MQSTIEYAPRARREHRLDAVDIVPFDSTISFAITSESEVACSTVVGAERLAQLVGVGQVAVVREGEVAELGAFEQRLRVDDDRRAGRRVARVADRDVAAQLAEDVFVEDRAEQAHLFVRADRSAVGGGDAGGFLAAMLQRVERKEREAGCVASGAKTPVIPHILLHYSLNGADVQRTSDVSRLVGRRPPKIWSKARKILIASR